MATTVQRPTLWVPSDWNAFFGFGTNILVNMLGADRPASVSFSRCRTSWCSAASCPRSG